MARSRAGTTDRPGTRARASARVASTLAVVALVTGGCTGNPPGPPAPSASGDQVALRVTTADGGASQLTDAERSELEGDVGRLLSQYLVSGFLGDYPRERFVESFDVFTSGGAELAAQDLDVLTASRIGHATDVQPQALAAELFFLVDDGKVLGATAHVDFELEATMRDGPAQTFTLTGRLMLNQQGGRWSVFGFDVTADDGAPLGEESP